MLPLFFFQGERQMAEDGSARERAAQTPFIVRLASVVAVLGGLVSLATAVVVVGSVFGRWFKGSMFAPFAPWIGPIDGDFEYVKMGTAIAVFAFLPYAQATRSNIVVDTFTNKLSSRTVDRMDAFWDLVYAAMMGVLTGCMVLGTMDFFRSGETTMMLQLVVWPAIAACTVLSALLTIVAIATAVQVARGQA